MSEMSYGNSPFFFDIGKEGSPVLNEEVENAMLIGQLELCCINRAVGCLRLSIQIQPVKG